jgi:hypothetical protein
MLKIWVLGGLGNQLFQYALYYYLDSQGKDVCLDTENFVNYKLHQGYELSSIFGVEPSICLTPRKKLFPPFLIKVASFIISKVNGYLVSKFDFQLRLNNKFIEYKSIKKNDSLFKLDYGQLNGYWQRQGYLGSIRGDLQKHLIFKIHLDISYITEKIQKDNAVIVHVRGGDYINLGWELGREYYVNALKYFSDTNLLNFFVITDDSKRLSELNLPFVYEVIDNFHGEFAYINMYLLTLAKNIILSNSTFSWWGAYLNDNYNLVTVPKKWIPDDVYDKIYYPEEWIKV